MIMPTKGPGGASSIFQTPLQANQYKAARSPAQDAQFDQVNISHPSKGLSFQQEMVARLVGDVRTVHTTGDIQRVKQEIQSGTYQVNANEIASKMLLEGVYRGNR